MYLYNETQKAKIVGRKLNIDQQNFFYSTYSQKKTTEDVEKFAMRAGDH